VLIHSQHRRGDSLILASWTWEAGSFPPSSTPCPCGASPRVTVCLKALADCLDVEIDDPAEYQRREPQPKERPPDPRTEASWQQKPRGEGNLTAPQPFIEHVSGGL
jgi:hypothetical protein